MAGITTHILDTEKGRPAEGVQITLEFNKENQFELIGEAKTDSDGRAKDILGGSFKFQEGHYRISFESREYFKSQDRNTFYPKVSIEFEVQDSTQHFHVPLLISGFGFSTYRGS